MALTQAQKAAMLLMSLDPSTAAELLKSARPETVTRIAAELAYLKSGAKLDAPASAPVKEFFQMLRAPKQLSREDFVRTMLEGAVGKAKCGELLGQVKFLVQAKDPFMDIRSAPTVALAKALEGESAAVAAMVLGELGAKKSAELLNMLSESLRPEIIRGMASGAEASVETRVRVAQAVQKRLAELAGSGQTGSDDDRRRAQLRKVAVLLRGLAIDSRKTMMATLEQKDKEAAQRVSDLMVTWDDIPIVAGRALQEVLRGVDSRKLAMALTNADERAVAKIRSNMSERASAMLDEETSLLGKVKSEDIDASREELLSLLRKLNAEGNLEFEEEQS